MTINVNVRKKDKDQEKNSLTPEASPGSKASGVNVPKVYSSVDLSKYNSGYQKSDSVLKAEQNRIDAENALKGYGDFQYAKQGDLSGIMDKILNREEFKYDLNGDALYKQYADKYITQGKMASQDVAGQAAAMTGGYGNSYAASVGNQAYQQSLQQLNDVIPELYQMAYDRYGQEGQDLLNQYSLLSADKNAEYGMWGDKRNQLIAERDYAANAANDAYARDYGEFNDAYNRDFSRYWQETQFGYGQDRDAVADSQWQANFDYAKDRDAVADAQWQQNFDYAKDRDAVADAQWRESFDYGKSRDEIADAQWQQNFDYAKDRDAAADAQWRESFDYGKQRDEVADRQWQDSFDYGKQRDEIADAQWRESFDYAANRDAIADAQWRESFDYGKSRDEAADAQWRESFDYGKEQDKIANNQWQQSFDYTKEQDKIVNDRYDEQLSFERQQAEKAEAHNKVLGFIGTDYKPSDSELSKAGLTREQYDAMSKYATTSAGKTTLDNVTSMSSAEIVEAMQGFKELKDNSGLEAFLDDLEATGRITQAQADDYYLKYGTGLIIPAPDKYGAGSILPAPALRVPHNTRSQIIK